MEERNGKDVTRIDYQLVPSDLGKALKQDRILAGYGSAEDFRLAIYAKTGYQINNDQKVRRIERGDMEPTLSYLFAASITLYGHYWMAGLNKLICLSMPHDFLDTALSEIEDAGSFVEDARARGHEVTKSELEIIEYSKKVMQSALLTRSVLDSEAKPAQ